MSTHGANRNYVGDAGKRYHSVKRRIAPTALPWVIKLRAEKFSSFVTASDSVFEFGVGSGWNLAGLQCARKIGFDVSLFLAERVEEYGIDFVSGSSTVPDESVDVVLCHHTLEHVPDPGSALQEMHRVLKPNGKLLLFVPYERERRYREFNPAEPNHHLYSWNVQTLGNLVCEFGFELVSADVGRFGYDRWAANCANRLHVGERGFRLIRASIHVLKPAYEVRVVAAKSRAAASAPLGRLETKNSS